jgi:hypothetical protein
LCLRINKRQEKAKGQSRNGKSRETGNIAHTRHKTKKNRTQKHNTTQKAKKINNTEPTKNRM